MANEVVNLQDSSSNIQVVAVTSGGTGQTTIAAARNAFGLGNTTGAVPIANGGTGANNVSSALKNLHVEHSEWDGKNLFPYEAWVGCSIARGSAVYENYGVTLTATGDDCYTNQGNSYYPVGARIPVTEGETITLSWEETTNTAGLVYIFPNGTTTDMVYVDNAEAKELSYTPTSDIEYVSIRFGVANSGDTISYTNIMVRLASDTVTDFVPYAMTNRELSVVEESARTLFYVKSYSFSYTISASGSVSNDLSFVSIPSGYSLLGFTMFSTNRNGVMCRSLRYTGDLSYQYSVELYNATSSSASATFICWCLFIKSEFIKWD